MANLNLLYSLCLAWRGHDFQKNVSEVKYVSWFSQQLLFETSLNPRRIQQDAAIDVLGSHVNFLLNLSDRNQI